MSNCFRVLSIAVVALALAAGAGADSLFALSGGKTGTLVTQEKARFEVGDLVTVMVRENVEASAEANTNTRKESDVESTAEQGDNAFLTATPAGQSQFLIPERLPNWKFETGNEHRGRGQTKRSNSLVTTISCVVLEVYDNGNMRIEGEKQVTVNREDTTLHVSGLVRMLDVTPSNTVESSRLANAIVQLRGCGPLWNNQRRGLITRFLDWFSPF